MFDSTDPFCQNNTYQPIEPFNKRSKIDSSIYEEGFYETSSNSSKSCYYCNTDKKYTCPKCHLVTCSVTCCKKHKEEFNCDGCINVIKYISKASYNSVNFRKDINFLEQMNRNITTCTGVKRSIKRDNPNKLSTHDFKAQKFKKFLKSNHNIEMLILPQEFSSRKENFSNYNQNKRRISWTIKFNKKLFQSVNGQLIWKDILTNIFGLKEDINKVDLLLQDFSCAKSRSRKLYCRLDVQKTITSSLTNKTILEYPTIITVPKGTNQNLIYDPYLNNYPMENDNFENLIELPASPSNERDSAEYDVLRAMSQFKEPDNDSDVSMEDGEIG